MNSDIVRLSLFLERIAPFVVLCGSYAREEETENSDLDFFVRQKPQDPYNDPPVDTSYLPDIVQIATELGYKIDSCVVGSITISAEETKVIQLEFSYLYKLPVVNPLGIRNILGTDFITCEDDKNADFEDCFECCDDWGNIIHLLPTYKAEINKFMDHGVI